MKIDFINSKSPIEYNEALEIMENYVRDIIDNNANEVVWLLEHKDIYTAGVSTDFTDILNKDINIIKTGRGGKITFHGKGMRILYLMLDLKKRNACDIKKYIANIQYLIINSLKYLGVNAYCLDDHIGVWVKNPNIPNGHDKIAAIGVRVRKWVSFHGVAINISPDLSKFEQIIACGINEKNLGITSLKELNIDISKEEFDKILISEFNKIFNA